MSDPVAQDELKYDIDCAKAEHERQAAIQVELDVVYDEMGDGQHDSEIPESSFIDSGTIAKVAREAQYNSVPTQLRSRDMGALKDFGLQLTDYALDTATRRVDSR